MIYDLGHVAIATRNLDEMKKFYESLGLRYSFTLENDKGEPWIVYMRLGGAFIELIKAEGKERANGLGLAHVCFLVDDMYDTIEELHKKGVETTEPNMGRDGNIQCWVKDPEGNQIELMQVLPGSPQSRAAREENDFRNI
ncbi:MAG: VOC family protein [Thermoprotei archaeon]|jgi:lactoylglutathione lyase